jgi:hypothetical protein
MLVKRTAPDDAKNARELVIGELTTAK